MSSSLTHDKSLSEGEIRKWNLVQLRREGLFKNKCDNKTLIQFRNRIPGLVTNSFQNYLEQQFFNYEFMRAVSCLLSSLSVPSRLEKYLFRIYFNKFSYIDDKRMLANFKDVIRCFVIFRSMRREAINHNFIGQNVVNVMRKYVLNFAYTFALFRSEQEIPNDYNLIINGNHYVVSEFISSNSLSNYLLNCTWISFLNVYVQIIYSLQLAFEKFKFVHCNLESHNVHLRYLSKEFQLPYNTEFGKRYITTDVIPVISDFSSSCCVLNNKIYGNFNLSNRYVRPDLGMYPVYDFYKLLMSSLEIAQNKNRSVFIEGKTLFQFFERKNDLETVLKLQKEKRYSLIMNENNNRFTFDKLMDFIKKNWNLVFLSKNSNQDMVLSSDQNIDESKILNDIGINLSEDPPVPNTVIEFYDLIKNRPSQSLKESFKLYYGTAMVNHLMRLQDLILMTNKSIESYSKTDATELKKHIRDNQDLINLYVESGRDVASRYNGIETINVINQLENSFRGI